MSRLTNVGLPRAGSSTQVSILLLPFCVVLAWIMGKPLDLNYSAFETAVLFITVLLAVVVLQASGHTRGSTGLGCGSLSLQCSSVTPDWAPAACLCGNAMLDYLIGCLLLLSTNAGGEQQLAQGGAAAADVLLHRRRVLEPPRHAADGGRGSAVIEQGILLNRVWNEGSNAYDALKI